MSDCTPNLCDMELKTFEDALAFNDKFNKCMPIEISGGEPTESVIFKDVIEILIARYAHWSIPVTVTTNGIWLTTQEELVKQLSKTMPTLIFQIVVDDRYYPVHVDESSNIFKYGNVKLCRDVLSIYPQGRALTNNLPSTSLSSRCFNIRALTKQLNTSDLSAILTTMNMKGYFCTPHIDIDGNIKLGESRLCPICSNIYKKEQEIIDDIINFKCHQCDFINNKLPEKYRRYVE